MATIIWTIILGWYVGSPSLDIHQEKIVHTIKVIHPGISLTDSFECKLVQVPDPSGLGANYYMDVESVVCGDSLCRVDIVRIYWDKIGRYLKLELLTGVDLEKAEGMMFTPEDYKLLSNSLADPESPLKGLYKYELVGKTTGEGVDAITGATVAINKNAYISGAIWTCYSLWHWVNGNSVEIIRKISGANLSISEFLNYLKSEDAEIQEFALEQLTEKKLYHMTLVESATSAVSSKYSLIKEYLHYMESADPDNYEGAMIQLIKSVNPGERYKFLSSLKRQKHLSGELIEDLSECLFLSAKANYQEVNLFMSILEEMPQPNPGIIKLLVRQLENENFLISRRIYWYLMGCSLNSNQQRLLNQFYNENSERLK